MTCSPKQSEFLLINNERPYNNTETIREIEALPRLNNEVMEITEINYTLTTYFTNELYNSCKYVLRNPPPLSP
jgi:hypothetical protein